MKVKRAIFVGSVEAPGGLNRVAYLQTTEPIRKDSFVESMRLCDVGLLAGDELYPLHTIRRLTLDENQDEPVAKPEPKPDDHLADIPWADDVRPEPKRRGRPPKPKA